MQQQTWTAQLHHLWAVSLEVVSVGLVKSLLSLRQEIYCCVIIVESHLPKGIFHLRECSCLSFVLHSRGCLIMIEYKKKNSIF